MSSKQKQPDLSIWGLLDTFTVVDAACLWVGIDPSTHPPDRSAFEKSQLMPTIQLLSTAIKEGIIPVDSSTKLIADRGVLSTTLVTRNDLKAFAESKNIQPDFLFDTLMPKAGVNGSPDTKSNAGRPRACPKELWLERLAILILTDKINLGHAQDAIAQALVEDLEKQGYKVKVKTVIKDWIGPIVRQAKIENK